MNKERLLVVGDIHGEYDMLCKVLKKADYNPAQDQLFFVGDYIDRGPQSSKVVTKIKELVAGGAIAIKGNHEEMAYNYIKQDGNDQGLYFRNGGRKTIASYKNFEQFKNDVMWLHELPLKKVVPGQYIFVHAGLKPGIGLKDQQKRDLLWIRNEFLMYDWSREDLEETIVAGHTPFPEVKYYSGVIIVDTGAGKGGYLSLLDLTNDQVYSAS
ncbi:MAG: metallophosphoesterase family protein [Halanaerobiaceae bacterium]